MSPSNNLIIINDVDGSVGWLNSRAPQALPAWGLQHKRVGGSKAAGPKAVELEPPEPRFNYPERHSLSWSVAIMSRLWE